LSQPAQRILASGRASEIVDLGSGRVLRRFKLDGADPAREAAVMAQARQHGFPVPEVLEVQDDAMVLERVDGPTMGDDLRARPETLWQHACTLARLHQELHRIEAPGGGTLLHLDLHHYNVLLGPDGPVVIDWTNARAGPADLDPAVSWVILMTSAGLLGQRLAAELARLIDVRSGLAGAVAFRLADRNVTTAERDAVRQLQA
jgi:aminoglycoside phosphotransferase (APT) family kinase protein